MLSIAILRLVPYPSLEGIDYLFRRVDDAANIWPRIIVPFAGQNEEGTMRRIRPSVLTLVFTASLLLFASIVGTKILLA